MGAFRRRGGCGFVIVVGIVDGVIEEREFGGEILMVVVVWYWDGRAPCGRDKSEMKEVKLVVYTVRY